MGRKGLTRKAGRTFGRNPWVVPGAKRGAMVAHRPRQDEVHKVAKDAIRGERSKKEEKLYITKAREVGSAAVNDADSKCGSYEARERY